MEKKHISALLIVLLCMTATVAQGFGPADPGTLQAEPGALYAPADDAVGGFVCGGFLDGFAVGMGVAVFAGCVWCGGLAIAAKVVDIMAC